MIQYKLSFTLSVVENNLLWITEIFFQLFDTFIRELYKFNLNQI